MSAAELNPYHAGNFDPVKADTGPAKRPTGLLVLAIIVIVFASMGLMGSLTNFGAYIANGGAGNYAGQFGDKSPINWNPEVLKKLTALGPAHSMRNIATLISSLIVDLFILVTAFGAIMGKKWGYAGFFIGCLLSIGLAVGQAASAHITSNEVSRVFSEQKEQTDDQVIVAKDDKDAPAAEMTSKVMEFMFMFMPIFMWAWCGIKAIFYGSTALYLRKSNVRAYFQRAAVT